MTLLMGKFKFSISLFLVIIHYNPFIYIDKQYMGLLPDEKGNTIIVRRTAMVDVMQLVPLTGAMFGNIPDMLG